MIEEHIRKKIASAIRDIPQADTFVSNRLSLLIEELEKWNKKYNLTAIRAPNEMIHGHIMDSLSALEFIKGKNVIDIGTGAGFPGLPLAIMMPKNHFLLIDGNGKKKFTDIEWKGNNILLFGSEGFGLKSKTLMHSDFKFKVKMNNNIESLNISNTVSVVCHHIYQLIIMIFLIRI